MAEKIVNLINTPSFNFFQKEVDAVEMDEDNNWNVLTKDNEAYGGNTYKLRGTLSMTFQKEYVCFS